MKLLLVSNSTQHGSEYLGHCTSELEVLLGDVERLLFVPFALHDHTAYTAIVRKRFAPNREVIGLHESADPVAAVYEAEAIFIGGGNTFRLLKGLYDRELIEPIRRRVREELPYLGTSAGSNVAAPTIKTTNDMPIVQPPSLEALDLVPFQINAHYIDADPDSKHMGETRAQRLREFHEENETPVLALREGAMVRVNDSRARLLGTTGALAFHQGREPEVLATGANLDEWVR